MIDEKRKETETRSLQIPSSVQKQTSLFSKRNLLKHLKWTKVKHDVHLCEMITWLTEFMQNSSPEITGILQSGV